MTDEMLGKVLQKAQFWQAFDGLPLNERQRLMLNKLLDGFDGKLNTSKWAKIAKCSQAYSNAGYKSTFRLGDPSQINRRRAEHDV